jgi:hypothetical protein
VAVLRIRRTTKTTLVKAFRLDEAATASTGAPMVTFTRADGVVVQGPEPAVGPDAQNGYAITFQGSDTLDWISVTWSATVGGDAVVLDEDLIEVVGGFYFTLDEGRATDRVFGNLATYPTSDLIARRIEVEDECERITGQAWVPRFHRAVLSGDGSRSLILPWPLLRRVRSLTVGGVAVVGASTLYGPDPLGILRRDAGWPVGYGNIVAEFEHGRDRPTPDIVRASKIRFRSLMLTLRSALPDRAERLATTEAGVFILASPTRDRVGIPEVDAAYQRAPQVRPGF